MHVPDMKSAPFITCEVMMGRLVCEGGGTFRAESWQLVTEAFSSPCGQDQEHIPAGQRQVHSPELQRPEPRQMERVLQMLRHLSGPWEICQT